MSEATSKRFAPKDGEAPMALADVELHRVFETDRDGLTSIRVWITAEATPVDETFQSITADLAFSLLHDGDELGTCHSRAVQFQKREPVAIKTDDDAHIDLNADITAIALRVDMVKVVHLAGELKLHPA